MVHNVGGGTRVRTLARGMKEPPGVADFGEGAGNWVPDTHQHQETWAHSVQAPWGGQMYSPLPPLPQSQRQAMVSGAAVSMDRARCMRRQVVKRSVPGSCPALCCLRPVDRESPYALPTLGRLRSLRGRIPRPGVSVSSTILPQRASQWRVLQAISTATEFLAQS